MDQNLLYLLLETKEYSVALFKILNCELMIYSDESWVMIADIIVCLFKFGGQYRDAMNKLYTNLLTAALLIDHSVYINHLVLEMHVYF